MSNRGWGGVDGVIDAFEPTGEPDAAARDRSRSTCSDGQQRHRHRRHRADARPCARRLQTEVQLLVPTVNRGAGQTAGIERKDIGFTCAGSCDYLTGGPFAFVTNLEAAGAWPPISESHVEMDGAWALYEAWVRLQHGDIDVALVFGSGKSSPSRPRRGVAAAARPVLPGAARPRPGRRTPASRRGRCSTSGKATERDFAEVVARSRRSAIDNPNAQLSGEYDVDALLAEPYSADPLRRHDLPPISDGAAAVVLARGDKARELTERPAWIRGIDHRLDPHQPGVPRPHDVGVDDARRRARPATTAARSTSPRSRPLFSPQEVILRESLGLPDGVDGQPLGRRAVRQRRSWPRACIRLIEAADRIMDGSAEPGPGPRHERPGAAAQPRGRSWRGSDGSSVVQSSASARPTTRRSATTSRSSASSARRRPAPSRTPSATCADIDAVVIGKAPDAFEGVIMPELFLADALGGRRQADAARAHRRQRRRLDVRRRLAPHRVGHPRPRAGALVGEAVRGQRPVGPGRRPQRRRRRRRRVRPVDARLHQAVRARPSTSAGWSRSRTA